MVSEEAAADGLLAVIFALDDFGRRAVERLFERNAYSPQVLQAYYQPGPPSGAGTVRQCFIPESGWCTVEAWADHLTLVDVFRRIMGVSERASRRVDLILITETASLTEVEIDSLLEAVKGLRHMVEGLDWVYVVAGGNFEPVLRATTDSDSKSLKNRLQAWLVGYTFDYLVLADCVRTDGAQLPPAAAEHAAAEAISALTLEPVAPILRQQLTAGRDQLDELGRIIAIGFASLTVNERAIRNWLEEWICARLALSLCDSAVDSRNVDEPGPSLQAGEDYQAIETRFIEANWDCAVLRALLGQYQSILEKLADETLRDLMRDAGKAAQALARQKVGVERPIQNIAPAPSVRKEKNAALTSLILIAILLAVAGVAAWQWNQVLWAVPVWVIAFGMFASALLFGERTIDEMPEQQPQRPAVPDFKNSIRAYRELQQRRQDYLKEIKTVQRKQDNLAKNLAYLRQLAIIWAVNEGSAPALPQSVCLRLSRAHGIDIEPLTQAFKRDCRQPVGPLTAEEPGVFVSRLRAFVQRRLAEGAPFSWPELVRPFNTATPASSDWISAVLGWLKIKSLPPVCASGRLNWLILCLPKDTPAECLRAIQSGFPPPQQVTAASTGSILLVQVTQGLLKATDTVIAL